MSTVRRVVTFLRLWLSCEMHGHDLHPPYRYKQRCGRCGRMFGSVEPPVRGPSQTSIRVNDQPADTRSNDPAPLPPVPLRPSAYDAVARVVTRHEETP